MQTDRYPIFILEAIHGYLWLFIFLIMIFFVPLIRFGNFIVIFIYIKLSSLKNSLISLQFKKNKEFFLQIIRYFYTKYERILWKDTFFFVILVGIIIFPSVILLMLGAQEDILKILKDKNIIISDIKLFQILTLLNPIVLIFMVLGCVNICVNILGFFVGKIAERVTKVDNNILKVILYLLLAILSLILGIGSMLIFDRFFQNHPIYVLNFHLIFIPYFMILLIILLFILMFLYSFEVLFENIIPNFRLSKKYSYLSHQRMDTIFQAFTAEKIPEARKFILRFTWDSPSTADEKLKILFEMVDNEKDEEVLDEIYKIHQEVRRYQRQKIGEEIILAKDFLQNVTGFDFSDPTIENNHLATLSPIDSARQQLLNWLKGETPKKPSIDKLLIYQWKYYEIGIGLKYSGQMGGDFYDLFQLPTANADNQVGVFISDFGLLVGDLTGHGVETALNLSKTHNFWAETDLSQDVLTTMQAFEQNFKTTFRPFPKREGCELCYLQLKGNEITLSRAGLHLGIIRNNQWHDIAQPPYENFMALGNWQSLPVKRYTRVELKAGETLIVYTDGLFENANQNGEQFGQDNFQQLLLQHQHLDMNSLIDTVFKAVYEHCHPEPIEDDETLLVIRRISSTTDLGD